jgi:hypothetical protein
MFIPNLPLPYFTLAGVQSGISSSFDADKSEKLAAALHRQSPSVHSNFEHKRLQGNSAPAIAVWLYSE